MASPPSVPHAQNPCCHARQENEDARRELAIWWTDLDWTMPVWDLIRQAREREKAAWCVLEPVAEDLRALADEVPESHIAPRLRRLADKLDP